MSRETLRCFGNANRVLRNIRQQHHQAAVEQSTMLARVFSFLSMGVSSPQTCFPHDMPPVSNLNLDPLKQFDRQRIHVGATHVKFTDHHFWPIARQCRLINIESISYILGLLLFLSSHLLFRSTLAPTKYSSNRVRVVQSSSIWLSPCCLQSLLCSLLAFTNVLAAIAVPSANTYFRWVASFCMVLVLQSRASCVSPCTCFSRSAFVFSSEITEMSSADVGLTNLGEAFAARAPREVLHRLDGAHQFGQLALPTAYASHRLCNIRRFSKPLSHPADVTMSKLSLAVRDDNSMERGPSNSAASPSAMYWRAALSQAHTWTFFSWLENNGGFPNLQVQLQLILRKTLLVFAPLHQELRSSAAACSLARAPPSARPLVQDSSSPSCCQQYLLITARSRIRSHARPKGLCAIGRTDSLQLRTATCEKQRFVARVQRKTRM